MTDHLERSPRTGAVPRYIHVVAHLELRETEGVGGIDAFAVVAVKTYE